MDIQYDHFNLISLRILAEKTKQNRTEQNRTKQNRTEQMKQAASLLETLSGKQ